MTSKSLQLAQLRLVIIESPYDMWKAPLVQELFVKMVDLKIRGYKSRHSKGVLPLDGTDFVATHHLVCLPRGGTALEPIMGFKTIDLNRCNRHGLPFPLLGVLRSSGAFDHEKAVQEILNRCVREDRKIAYGSSWTADPELLRDRENAAFLRELMPALLVSYLVDAGIHEQLGCGSLRLKTNLVFENLGYERLTSGGEILPPFQQASLIGDEAVALHCPRFNDYALGLVEKYRAFFHSRMVISPEMESLQEAA